MTILVNRIKYLTRIFGFLVLLITSSHLHANPSSQLPFFKPAPPKIEAPTHLLFDINSQKVLTENHASERVEPASLTKMMTVFVIDSEIKAGRLHYDDIVQISKKAWKAPGSRMFLEVGSQVSVLDLLRGTIILSGNDASIALAEHAAGSEKAFADLMNQHAQALGMTNTHFANATGLPDKEHYTTAHDMGLLATALIQYFPETYKIYSEKSYAHQGIKQFNRNRLLWQNHAVDGIKTGHTDNAGYCLVASGQKDNMRLVAIVMGAKNDEARTTEANRLLTWGFRFYETHKLYQTQQKLQSVRVWLGGQEKLDVGLAKDLYVTIYQGHYPRLKATLNIPKVIKAPLKENEKIGTLSIKLDDEIISEQPLVTLQQIPKGGLWGRMTDSVALAFHSLLDKVNI